MENPKLISQNATPESYEQPEPDLRAEAEIQANEQAQPISANEQDQAKSITQANAAAGLKPGKVLEGYMGMSASGDKVGYVESIGKDGKAKITLRDRTDVMAYDSRRQKWVSKARFTVPKTVKEADKIAEPRTKRLEKYSGVLDRVRRSKLAQAAGAAALLAGVTGGASATTANAVEKAPASIMQEQFDSGHSPYKTAQAQEDNTFPQSAVTEQERYEKMLEKQYAEDDKLSTFDSKNKISEKAFGESPLVEGDAFATWEKGMDQLNHNSAAQAHVMWNLPSTLKEELRIDGQRLSDLNTEQIQAIFDTNLQARDTLVSTVTDMIEDGDVSLKMVTKNTAYRSYHIQVDENGKKHIVETPYLPQAERHVLIVGFKDKTEESNVDCGFQDRDDIAPEQVAAAIAAAAVASQAPGQSPTPEAPKPSDSPSNPDTPTTPEEPNNPNNPDKPDEPNNPENPENPEEPKEEEPEEEEPNDDKLNNENADENPDLNEAVQNTEQHDSGELKPGTEPTNETYDPEAAAQQQQENAEDLIKPDEVAQPNTDEAPQAPPVNDGRSTEDMTNPANIPGEVNGDGIVYEVDANGTVINKTEIQE